MSEPWFNWENKTPVGPGVFALHDFLTPKVYHALKQELRVTPTTWHNNYQNRIVAEHVSSPVAMEFGARMLPYLTKEFGDEYCVTSARIYLDLSNSWMFPHFDSNEFAISFQLYLADVDLPGLGTQFCFNDTLNQQVEQDPDIMMRTKGKFIPESEYVTIVPFRKNHGYINFNQPRKIHKTLPVPPGQTRESLHLNFRVKTDNQMGLENFYYQRLKNEQH